MNAATKRAVAMMNASLAGFGAMSSPSGVRCHGRLLERKRKENCDANHALVE
jgi:hypothetical protein